MIERTEMTAFDEGFSRKVQLELKRATRYRTFISLIIVDLNATKNSEMPSTEDQFDSLVGAIKRNVRETDEVAVLVGNRIGLLTPETSRQGAEQAARRVAEIIRHETGGTEDNDLTSTVPLEIASYPDASGQRTIADFVEELAERTIN